MPKKKFTKAEVLAAAKKLHVDLDVISLKTLKIGLQIELEHGLVDIRTNITDDNIIPTMKIVLAHLREGLTYYDLLVKLEAKLDKIRQKKGRPNLYID